MREITYPPEMLPAPEEGDEVEVFVEEALQKRLEMRAFTAICKHLIDIIKLEDGDTVH